MYIKVKATPNTKKESLQEKKEDSFLISVKEPARKNLANKRILELVAEHFEVPVDTVRIVSGHHSPSKLIYIDKS